MAWALLDIAEWSGVRSAPGSGEGLERCRQSQALLTQSPPRSSSPGRARRCSSSTCSATFSSPAASAKRSATTCSLPADAPSRPAARCSRRRATPACSSSTRAKVTCPICRTHRRPRSSAARQACASATPVRWAGSSFAARPGTTSSPALYPAAGEIVIDKSGKGAFYNTDLDALLRSRGIENLLVCGVTTEVCVNTTVREANDRGYRCVVLADCCASYFPEFHEMGLKMIKAQGGIFGWVSTSADVIAALAADRRHRAARSGGGR